MPNMSLGYPPPRNDADFESLCLRIYQRHWNSSDLKKFARRGQKQHGCDLVGTDQRGRIVAIQCKLREASNSLTLDELKRDIEAAVAFKLKIDRFGIATSAKRDPVLQQAIVEINQRHGQVGAFVVEIDFWDDIQELLNQYPEIADGVYGLSQVGVQSPISTTQRDVMAPGETGGGRATDEPTDIHLEIDEAAGYLKSHQPGMTLLLLERIRKRHADRFTRRCTYRVSANRAHAEVQMGLSREAAQDYFQAHQAQPADPDARWMEVHAHLLLGDRQKSHELASQLIVDHPEHLKARLFWIESLPDGVSVAETVAQIPAHQLTNPEISLAMARLAQSCDDLERAEQFARVTTRELPDWVEGQIQLGQILLRKAQRGVYQGNSAEQKAVLSEASRLLSSAEAEVREYESRSQMAPLWCNLAAVHLLLHQPDSAETFLSLALPEAANSPEVARSCSAMLLALGQAEKAIDILKVTALQDCPHAALQLAELLADRNQPGDRDEARNVLIKSLTDNGDYLRDNLHADMLEVLIRVHTALNDVEAAKALLTTEASRLLSEGRLLLIRAQLEMSAGNQPEATRLILDATDKLNPKHERRWFKTAAQLLERHGAFAAATDAWLKLASPATADEAAEHLVHCAQRAERWGVISEFCRGMRLAGISNSMFIRAEIGAMERTSPSATLDLLRELELSTTDEVLLREIGVHRRLLTYQLHRENDSPLAPDQVPRISDLPNAVLGRAVVEVLRRGDTPFSAVVYAYDLYRAFPDTVDAWAALAFSANLDAEVAVSFPKHDVAELGTAVCYRENDTGETHTVILEEGHNPRAERLERAANDPLVQQLLGCRVNDIFELRSSPLPARTGTVVSIQSKYEFRWRYCFKKMEHRFGTESPIMEFHVPNAASGEPDIEAFTQQFKGVFASTDDASRSYDESLIPAHFVAIAAGRCDFEAFASLRSSGITHIKCATGTEEERTAAYVALRTSKAVVLDETALATLYLLRQVGAIDLPSILARVPFEILVSEFAIQQIKAGIARSWRRSGDRHFLGMSDGQLVAREISADQADQIRSNFERFIEEIESSCTTCTATSRANPDPARTAKYTQVLGRSGFESIMLASEQGNVLWTDDLFSGVICTSGFEAGRVWTQTVFNWLASQGHISRETEERVTIELLTLGYAFTSISANHILRACETSGWLADREPLRTALNCFADPAIDFPSIVRLLAGTLVACWRAPVLDSARQEITLCILNRINTRPGGHQLIGQMLSRLDTYFGLDVINAARCAEVIQSWMSVSSGIITP